MKEEEQLTLATVEKEIPTDDEEDEEVLATTKKRKESRRRRRKSISPRLDSTRWRQVLNDLVNEEK